MTYKKKDVIMGKRYSIDGEYRYVAYNYEPWIDDALLCQYTQCSRCKTKLISWAKDARCPKCGKMCYLTQKQITKLNDGLDAARQDRYK